ncbi:MAG TPA: Ig-like domain-containing protein, partial [Pyrinomonadaceae bacterium]
MRSLRSLFAVFCALLLVSASFFTKTNAQNGSGTPVVKSAAIQPANPSVEVGQKIQFSVTAKDEQGRTINEKPSTWFAAPFDLAKADENGSVSFYEPGEVMVGAIVGGKPVFTKVVVKQAPVKTIDIDPLSSALIVGGAMKLNATPRVASGDPRTDVTVNWISDNPAVATVDAAGLAIGVSPGKATLKASADAATGSVTVNVVKGSITTLAIQPRTTTARTGDVVHFNAISQGSSASYAPRWAVSG